MPCTTAFDIPGTTVQQTIGLCFGLIVRSVGFAKGFSGGLRSLKAGEVPQFTEVVEEAGATRWSDSSPMPRSSVATR